jgi:hypothetical protein
MPACEPRSAQPFDGQVAAGSVGSAHLDAGIGVRRAVGEDQRRARGIPIGRHLVELVDNLGPGSPGPDLVPERVGIDPHDVGGDVAHLAEHRDAAPLCEHCVSQRSVERLAGRSSLFGHGFDEKKKGY